MRSRIANGLAGREYVKQSFCFGEAEARGTRPEARLASAWTKSYCLGFNSRSRGRKKPYGSRVHGASLLFWFSRDSCDGYFVLLCDNFFSWVITINTHFRVRA